MPRRLVGCSALPPSAVPLPELSQAARQVPLRDRRRRVVLPVRHRHCRHELALELRRLLHAALVVQQIGVVPLRVQRVPVARAAQSLAPKSRAPAGAPVLSL